MFSVIRLDSVSALWREDFKDVGQDATLRGCQRVSTAVEGHRLAIDTEPVPNKVERLDGEER
jgi:hypothetical protein